MIYVVEADFLIQFIDNLLVVERDVCVAISQVVQDVAEMSAVPINEIAPILVFAHVVTTGEHYREH